MNKPFATIAEYREYHDFLNHFLHDEELSALLDDDTSLVMRSYRDVFCWILGHENPTFPENMANWADVYDQYYNLRDEYPN